MVSRASVTHRVRVSGRHEKMMTVLTVLVSIRVSVLRMRMCARCGVVVVRRRETVGMVNQ